MPPGLQISSVFLVPLSTILNFGVKYAATSAQLRSKEGGNFDAEKNFCSGWNSNNVPRVISLPVTGLSGALHLVSSLESLPSLKLIVHQDPLLKVVTVVLLDNAFVNLTPKP